MQRWLRTSAKPMRAGMPAARAAAVRSEALPTQNPARRLEQALARKVSTSVKSQ